jgi:hypothetical protein
MARTNGDKRRANNESNEIKKKDFLGILRLNELLVVIERRLQILPFRIESHIPRDDRAADFCE